VLPLQAAGPCAERLPQLAWCVWIPSVSLIWSEVRCNGSPVCGTGILEGEIAPRRNDPWTRLRFPFLYIFSFCGWLPYFRRLHEKHIMGRAWLDLVLFPKLAVTVKRVG